MNLAPKATKNSQLLIITAKCRNFKDFASALRKMAPMMNISAATQGLTGRDSRASHISAGWYSSVFDNSVQNTTCIAGGNGGKSASVNFEETGRIHFPLLFGERGESNNQHVA